jgi:hypothetical protein
MRFLVVYLPALLLAFTGVHASVAESFDTPALELRSPIDADLGGPAAIKKGPLPRPPKRKVWGKYHEVSGRNIASTRILARNCTSLAKRCV